MDKSPLGIHEIKLVVQPSPSFSNSSCVREHADSSLDLGKVTPWHYGGRLVVDPNFEPCGTPVNKLDRALGLDCGNCRIHVLGNNISTVEHAAGHVLATPGVTLHHLVCRLKTGIGYFCHRKLFMVSLLRTDDRCIGYQREMDPGVGYQVGLELCQIHIECPIESERCRNGRDNLTNQTVKVGVCRSLYIKIPTTDVIDCLIVHHKGTIRVVKSGMSGQDGVVRLNHSSCNLWGWVNSKLKLGLLSIVNRESLHEQRGKSRASSSSERVENEESLKSSAVVSKLPYSFQDKINDFLANGVMAPGIVVSSVFLACDQLFRVEHLPVGSSPHLINHSRFKINKDGSWDMLPSTSLIEESVEAVILSANSLVRRHLPVRLYPVLQAVQLPAGVAHLHSRLSYVDRDAFSHLIFCYLIPASNYVKLATDRSVLPM